MTTTTKKNIWYKDFDAVGGLRKFLYAYLSAADNERFLDNAAITYFKYDWSLNDRARDVQSGR